MFRFVRPTASLAWLLASGLALIAQQPPVPPPAAPKADKAKARPPRGRTITLGDVTAFEAKDGGFLITAGKDQVRVFFYGDDLFRIWLGPDGTFSEPPEKPEDTPMVVGKPTPVAVTWKDAGEYYRIQSRTCTLRVTKAPLRFALFDKDNLRVIWQEDKGLSYGPTSTQSLKRGDNEHFYGCGMQNGYFSHRDASVNIKLNYGRWGDGTTSNPVPFYMSTAGYGAFRNTFAPGVYDFKATTTLGHEEARFDCFYFHGPSLKKVLEGYTALTGRPFLPPRWGLEFGDADCYNKTGKTADVLTKVAQVYRKHDMPGGWILPNDGYGCGYTDLGLTVQELHKLGFYTGLWTEKGVERIAHEVGKEGTRLMKLDVAWVGPGYQFALNGGRAAYEGIEQNSDSRGFVWTVGGWSGTQRYATVWSGDQPGNWEFIRFHIPTVLGAGLSAFNGATGDVDGIYAGSALTQVRDLQWKCFTPILMIISGWSKETNKLKQPWIFGEPYTGINRKYLKLKMRLTPYMYTLCREAHDTGVPAARAMVLEFPQDPVTWGKRTQYQFMCGPSLLVAPVFEDSPVRNDIYLPEGKWIDHWDGKEYFGPTTLNGYAAPLEKLPLFVKAGAILPMYPEMLHDREKPKDPVTFEVYPSGASRFELYEDDGTTQDYRRNASARTPVEVQAPSTVEAGGGPVTVTVHPTRGTFKGMPSQRAYLLELHVPAKPTAVVLEDLATPTGAKKAPPKALPSLKLFEKKDEFKAATVGAYFDPRERRGVLHIKVPSRSLDAGFRVRAAF